jgi:uncharacterized membrane protein
VPKRRGVVRTASPYLLAAVLTVTGASHFRWPRMYAAIVPKQLPATYPLVYASGAAEVALAAGLAVPRTRRLAGWATAALLVAVFPANVQMAWDWRHRRPAQRWGALLRLPVQVPLVVWAVSVARSAVRTTLR